MTGSQPPWLNRVAHGWSGLEIGALDKPVFTRDLWNVRYVDHASREELQAKYAEDALQKEHLDDIVDVDIIWTGETRLVDAIGDIPIDFVFASHVFEHVPDPIGWLDELANVLRDGGLVCLAIPDMRLCFDVNRTPTQMSDLIDAHLRNLHAPSYRQIYDFHSRIIEVDAAAMWAGNADYRNQWRSDLDPDGWAYELCMRHHETGEYVDAHCHVFTPQTFLDLFKRACRLGLSSFRIAYFESSQPGTIEFHVILEKLPKHADAAERLEMQLSSIPGDFADLVPWPPSHETPQIDPRSMVVSDSERRLLLVKRQIFERARSIVTGLLGR